MPVDGDFGSNYRKIVRVLMNGNDKVHSRSCLGNSHVSYSVVVGLYQLQQSLCFVHRLD
jgi:hypothetical protein